MRWIILETKFDQTDRKILKLLMADGRMSFAELGRQVGLSLPAAADRVRRLEDAGIIEGYQAKLNLKSMGWATTVFVLLTITPSAYQAKITQMEKIPEIIEAHHISGKQSFILKLRLANLEDLESILRKINQNGETESFIVLSTSINTAGSSLIGKIK